MRRLVEGARALLFGPGMALKLARDASLATTDRAWASFPPSTPIERMGPGPYDTVAKEAQAEIAAASAPIDFRVPAHALAEIADLRKQLAEAQAVADGKTLAQLTADMPKTEAGRISELAAVRADRDRLERVNDRLRGELAELRAMAGV